MAAFKVGDRVRFKISGAVGVVDAVDENLVDSPFMVGVAGVGYWANADMIEHAFVRAPEAETVPEPPPGFVGDFVKFDGGKPRADLLPPMALLEVAKVLSFGANKYAPGNWRKADKRSRYHAALERHILMWSAGEDIDPESGLPHLAHAACCVLFLLECELLGLGEDDRVNKVLRDDV